LLDRKACGELPPKHHTALRTAQGELRYEECLTRNGFDGAYTIAYHQHRPQALRATGEVIREPLSPALERCAPLSRKHFRTRALRNAAVAAPGARLPLLHNRDLVIGVWLPESSDAAYCLNAGADELLFVLSGRGCVRSALGDVAFTEGDYVLLPRGVLHRLIFEPGSAPHLLSVESFGGVSIPARFRNPLGQLRMDAPYSHRDFKRPEFRGPLDEGIRELWIKDGTQRQKFALAHNPLDVVGWDGTLYPWALPILSFQPRVSSVHLPPTWHGTFEAAGALICSFVPRPLDFHPDAVPCPYPHLSADVDEVLFYVDGDFSSRLGVERGSMTLHPGGVPHGPHPGRYEHSIGATRTEEVAVMLDVYARLAPTSRALEIEDESYDASFGAVHAQ
jgi:homogentisate 1,2-dioxygenase